MEEMLLPVKQFESEAQKANQEAKLEHHNKIEKIKAEIDLLKIKIRRAIQKDEEEKADQFKKELISKKEESNQSEPRENRFLVNDATVEKLGTILRDNPNGILLFRDELSGFFYSFDKPGYETARPFFLEAWSGS